MTVLAPFTKALAIVCAGLWLSTLRDWLTQPVEDHGDDLPDRLGGGTLGYLNNNHNGWSDAA